MAADQTGGDSGGYIFFGRFTVRQNLDIWWQLGSLSHSDNILLKLLCTVMYHSLHHVYHKHAENKYNISSALHWLLELIVSKTVLCE